MRSVGRFPNQGERPIVKGEEINGQVSESQSIYPSGESRDVLSAPVMKPGSIRINPLGQTASSATPIFRAMTMRWISEVPSPISSTF